MKPGILLTIASTLLLTSADAQKRNERTTAFAITGAEKGSNKWTEVNLIDVKTGEVVNNVYHSKAEVKRLNARTGKPIAVKAAEAPTKAFVGEIRTMTNGSGDAQRVEIRKIDVQNLVQSTTTPTAVGAEKAARRIVVRKTLVRKEEPFATNSAACAFDKKHNRLYYTPMGINQLRYIDMKAKTPSVYYFEDEAFGSVAGSGDVQNQITRMVIAGDGNGYALSNSADHLIQFTTRNKPVITNLGAIADDPSNGKFSIRNSHVYGGDMVADDADNLYLITANRRVYKISLKSKTALYLGSIKGLPDGYTTNGAVVDKNSNIIVTSSNATTGYFQFDLKTLKAEKVSAEGAVFNASDLANANLISAKKQKKEKPAEEKDEETLVQESKLNSAVEKSIRGEESAAAALSVYPNPVSGPSTRLSMSNFPAGVYEAQLLDLGGKLVRKVAIQLNGKAQTLDFEIPRGVAKGTYLIRVQNAAKDIVKSEKIVVR